MPRPLQRVDVYSIQDRRKDPRVRKPYVVRWAIDGRQRSRSFRTKTEADRFRHELQRAQRAGQRFDRHTGEPEAWELPLAELGVHDWARRWLGENWPEWQPRTRDSMVEALARFAALAVNKSMSPPEDLRRYLAKSLPPDGERDPAVERWLEASGLRLCDLDRITVADINRQLGLGLDGTPLAATTANRFRTCAHACVLAAVELGILPSDPWPRRSRSRSRRKAVRQRRSVDVFALPDPTTMRRAIDAMTNQQYGSRVYRVMTAVAYYAGLRPSEVVMLRRRSVDLPVEGWGRVDVTQADIAWDVPGEPKTGRRRVPIPPDLVDILREWVTEADVNDPDQLLFRTERGTRPSTSNWGRSWRRALASIGEEPLRVYDCRHAAATTWLRAGVPLGETARRLGHSVETLVSTYVGAIVGDEDLGNARIEAELARPPSLTERPLSIAG
jgi:integrase